MRKLKISIAAIAFVLTAGVTYAAHHSSKSKTGDCSTLPNGQGQIIESSTCTGTGEPCCYLLSNNNEVQFSGD